MLNIKSTLVVIFFMLVGAEAIAERQWPEAVFECQVVTTSGAQGLVSMQSVSLAAAEAGVIGLPATTRAGTNDVAARVVQCIDAHGGQTFTDASFQAWYADLVK